MAKKKATEDQFNELHNLVTTEFLNRIKSGEASTQDLKAACDWLAKNDIVVLPLTVIHLISWCLLCQQLIQN